MAKTEEQTQDPNQDPRLRQRPTQEPQDQRRRVRGRQHVHIAAPVGESTLKRLMPHIIAWGATGTGLSFGLSDLFL